MLTHVLFLYFWYFEHSGKTATIRRILILHDDDDDDAQQVWSLSLAVMLNVIPQIHVEVSIILI